MSDELLSRYRRLVVNEVPNDEFIQFLYRITPAPDLDLRGAGIRLLLILSQRTILPLGFESVTRDDIEKVGVIVPPSGPQGSGPITIALPPHVVSRNEGLTQLILTATSAAEYGYTSELWLDDILLPASMMSWFPGPRLGVAGIRNSLRVYDRPLLGYIVKSRTRATLGTVLESCRAALQGGVDLLVDDLLSTDPDGELAFRPRIKAIAELVRNHNLEADKTGSPRAGYVANVGASAWRAEEYLEYARSAGVFGCLVDCFTMGFGNVKELIDRINDSSPEPLAFFATNMGSGIMGRNPDDEGPGMAAGSRKFLRTGFSEALTAKLARLAGADGVHTGTIGSECFEVAEYANTHRSLRSARSAVRTSFAIAEGDLQLVHVPENVFEMGTDVIIETASGIANHPNGVAEGARAFRLLVGCLNGDVTREDIDDIFNVLRNYYPKTIDPLLPDWKRANDQRIREGWTVEKSIQSLQSAFTTPELKALLARKPPRR